MYRVDNYHSSDVFKALIDISFLTIICIHNIKVINVNQPELTSKIFDYYLTLPKLSRHCQQVEYRILNVKIVKMTNNSFI